MVADADQEESAVNLANPENQENLENQEKLENQAVDTAEEDADPEDPSKEEEDAILLNK